VGTDVSYNNKAYCS